MESGFRKRDYYEGEYMKSISPVLTEEYVEAEKIIALDQQDKYYPIIILKVIYPDDSLGTVTRFEFSEKERDAIAKGADLILTQPHHSYVMPIAIQLAFKNEHPLEGID